jgi:ABC-type multidrug transport system fused ATPase/permease subunit
LHQVDDIIVMSNGSIIEHGTFNELMAKKGNLATLVADHVQIVDPNQPEVHRDQMLNSPVPGHHSDSINAIEKSYADAMAGTAIEEEAAEDDLMPSDSEPMKLIQDDQSVFYKKSPFVAYLRSGPGILATVLIFAFFFLVHGVRIGSDYWLSLWFARSTGRYLDISDEVFVGAYGGAVVLFTIGILSRGLIFSFMSIRKSRELHIKMFKSVIYATMSFFDSTPIGRILNAFARHQYNIDFALADTLMQFLQYLPLCLGAIILVIAVMWQTIGVFGGALVVGAVIMLFIGNTEDKLRNKEAITRSTIFSHLTATLEGLFSIRAYECQDRFINLYEEKIDENHKYQYANMEGTFNLYIHTKIFS